MSKRGVARHTGLLIVVFVATLVLLAGGWALIAQGDARSGLPRPPAEAGKPSLPGSTARVSTGPAAQPSGPSSSGGASPRGDPSAGSPGADVLLTGAGDIADCDTKGAQQTSDLLVDQPGMIFTAGDNAYESGTAAQFDDCYQPTWGRVKDRTLPAPGNHDYETPKAAGYRAYFGEAAAPNGTTWYSTEVGTWHVIVLDSNCSQVGGCRATSPQGRWLAAELASHSDTTCTLAIWHHPRFSSGEHGNDDRVGPFWDQLVAAKADLIVNGHDHDYERFAPQNAAGEADTTAGIREFVVGTGGAGLRAFPSLAANSEFRIAGAWGLIRLTLQPADYRWEFLAVGGGVADSGSAPCH
jgi:hypothetical protein